MERPRILVVDDEQHIADVVVYVLEENGFTVSRAADGDEGLQRFRAESPDLVVLDLTLPGIPGLELFGKMRATRPDVPVIMLTARSEEIDRVLGLELGADDYVTKPFSTRELAARVKTVLRRAGQRQEGTDSGLLTSGVLCVDPSSYTVTYQGTRLQLTRAEFAMMECLARHPARVFTRDDLLNRIYDSEHAVTDRSIDAHVKRLRRKFEEVGADVNPIETVHGLGYKLNQDLGS